MTVAKNNGRGQKILTVVKLSDRGQNFERGEKIQHAQ